MRTANEHPRPKWPQWVAGVALGVLLGGTGWFVLQNYSLRAWSDPINWLSFAKHFRTEFFQSRFACGYALFLAWIEPITGPYWVFLSNLPLLLALVAVIASTAALAFPEELRAVRPIAALTAASLTILADPPSLLVLSQPYRDALAHLCLFLCLALTVRYVRPHPTPAWALFLAGLALGAAYSVREPSLLMAGPIGSVVIVHHRAYPSSRILRRIGWAVLGLAVGAIPLLAQSILRSGSTGLLPPQALTEQRLLPGLHFSAIASTGSEVWKYLTNWSSARPWLVFTWILGFTTAVHRRHWTVLALLIVPAAMYGLFYSFYWTFVPRYLWIVWPFAAITTGWLVAIAIHSASARWNLNELVPASVVATALVAIGTAFGLGSYRVAGPRFTIPDARRLTEAVHQLIPPGARLLAPRHFCEIVRWFNQLDSWPASWKWDPSASDPVPSLQAALSAEFAEGKPVYAAQVQAQGRRDVEFTAIERAFQTCPIGKLCLTDYGLGNATVTFYSLRPWTTTTQDWWLVVPASNLVLAVDAGHLQAPTTIQIGTNEPSVVRPGANFFRLNGPRTVSIRLCSTRPIARLPLRLYPPEEAIPMDFDMSAPFPSHAWLNGGFDLPPYGMAGPRVQLQASGVLPAAIQFPNQAHWAIFRLRATRSRPGNSIQCKVSVGTHEWIRSVRMDRKFQDLEVGPWVSPEPPADMPWTITILAPNGERALELDTITILSETARRAALQKPTTTSPSSDRPAQSKP